VPVAVPPLGFDAQALSKISDRRINARGIENAIRRRLFCAANLRNNIASIRNNQIGTCRRILVAGRQPFAKGRAEPCSLVDTVMVAVVPCVSEPGVAEHVLNGTVLAQLKPTLEEKPLMPVKLTAFL
jgi:hypothetical protein